jgi:hypothetical protein
MSRRITTLRKNYPKEYWKILNTVKSTKQPDIEFKEISSFVMEEFIFSFNSAVIVGSMFNVFSGSLVSFKVFKSLKKLKSSLNSISGCLVDFPVFKNSNILPDHFIVKFSYA